MRLPVHLRSKTVAQFCMACVSDSGELLTTRDEKTAVSLARSKVDHFGKEKLSLHSVWLAVNQKRNTSSG